MALTVTTLNVTTQPGSARAYGRATHDLDDPGAALIAATVVADPADRLRQSGTSARARIDTGVIAVDVDAPVGAGTVAVLVTTES